VESADALEGKEAEVQALLISHEYLNTLRICGLPPHTLQPGMPVMVPFFFFVIALKPSAFISSPPLECFVICD
jgi:hypothetical protein